MGLLSYLSRRSLTANSSPSSSSSSTSLSSFSPSSSSTPSSSSNALPLTSARTLIQTDESGSGHKTEEGGAVLNQNKQEKVPSAYLIEESKIIRRRSSVQRHLDNAPPIPKGLEATRGKFPHKYKNIEHLFPHETLYEYPTLEYEYSKQDDHGYVQDLDMKWSKRVDVTRTITDGDKNIKGVIYHPKNKNGKTNTKFRRAKELYEEDSS